MSRQIQDVYVVAATRAPIGKAPKGVFRNTRPDDLLVHTLRAALAQVPSLDPAAIEDVIAGCAIPEAQQGLNVARTSALLAGLPDSVGGVTVNRFCASGLTAVAMAADRIRVGEAEVMIAAGTESMSMVPMMGNRPSINPRVFLPDEDVGIAYGMGLTAEKVALQWKVSREDQDAFALESHRRAIAAQQTGEFDDEISPIEITERNAHLASGELELRTRTVSKDEGPRADTSLEALARLRPVFASPRGVDGKPTGMGSGPKEAIPAALKTAGLSVDDLGWIELNEAFAAQSLAVIRELGLDPARVNPLGGAIALGHPLGATGAVRSATVVHGLRRRKLKYGMVTMCVGTGMGAAGIFERV